MLAGRWAVFFREQANLFDKSLREQPAAKITYLRDVPGDSFSEMFPA